VSVLFIIEAPGKARALEELLGKIGLDAKVQATKGHLYAMPQKLQPLGIDCNFREYGRALIDESIGQRIRDMATEAKTVYIATDADQEGEVIAWDVAELIFDIRPDPYRVRLKGMDEDSIREALDNTTLVNKRDAVPGRTRAIVDRMIGSVFSQEGIAVGRVSTALLGLVRDNPPATAKIKMTAPSSDGGRPWMAETDIRYPIDDVAARKLVKVRFPALDMASSRPLSRPPLNMGDIMVRAGDMMDMSPKEASTSMQRLYEAGRMSYPRAGARGISRGAIKKIHAAIQRSKYAFSPDQVADKKETEVHDAPYPIGGVDIQNEPTRQGFEEGLRTLVGREIVKSGQSHVMQLGVGEVAGRHLKKLGFSTDICDLVAKLEWRREEGPRYPGQESWPESDIVERRQDTVLLEAAVKHGLGRPSTWANQIEKFLSRGLVKDDFSLTAKGKIWASASPELLLDPRISAYIEEACEKNIKGMMDDPSREPWELLAEKIVAVLPGAIKEPLHGAVDGVEPHPLPDPVAPFRKTVTVDDILQNTREKTYDYAPAMPSLTDY
jgi:DNA topoisomerase-1